MDYNIVISMRALTCSGVDASTSCKNLMNFGPVTPEMRRFICVHFCTCIGRKSVYPFTFVAIAFRNALEECNVDVRVKNCNDTLTLEFTRLSCIQQASISTRVS